MAAGAHEVVLGEEEVEVLERLGQPECLYRGASLIRKRCTGERLGQPECLCGVEFGV